MKTLAWDKDQILTFVKDVIDLWGAKGWMKLSHERQTLEIRSKALSVLMAQAAKTIAVEDIKGLAVAMDIALDVHLERMKR